MRVGVVGAGAIGGFLAAAFARAGVPVAAVARGEHLAAIERHGLRVDSDLGAFTVPLPVADDVRTLGRFDVLLLTFKAHQWPELLEQIRPFAGTPTTIVTLQNGLPFWYVRNPPLRSVDPHGAIARVFRDDQIVGGVVHVSGELVAAGHVKQSGGLRYVLGAPSGGLSEAARRLVALFRGAGLAAEFDDNIRATVWLKLVNNAALNSLSVLYHSTIRPMLSDPSAREQARRLMIEALCVGRAMKVVDDVDVDARIEYAARLNDVKTSTLQDYERGRSLELDPIVGAVIELAQRHDIAVPQLKATYAALQERASGKAVR